MNKLLTIVIPTYNMEAYLNRCLDSLIVSDEQLQGLEVLVINDGSKDNSSLIAHEYEAKYPNTFRVIDKENGNYGSCVNRGLKEAKGKYIKVLDADDWFDTKSFENFISCIANIDADLILSDFSEVDATGRICKIHEYYTNDNKKIDECPSLLDMWMHAVTYKVENLRDIGYTQTEGISYTDQEWIFHPMVKVNSIYCFNQSLYQYLVGREGQTVDIHVWHKNMSHEIKTLKHRIALFESLIDYGNAEKYLRFRLVGIALLVYKRALLNFCDSSIIELDLFIKDNCQWLYQELRLSKARSDMPYYFVKLWHKTAYNTKLVNRLYKICKIIYGIKNKLL